MAIAGPEYECLYADVRSNRRDNVSSIWNKSFLPQGIQDGSFKFPDDKKLSNSEITPYVFIEDDAFALKNVIMKLFLQQDLTGERRVHNYRHTRAQRIPENQKISLGFYLTNGEYFYHY